MAEDVALPQPFEVVFEVGQMSSSTCINISLISDAELEGEEFFTIYIVSAGYEPHARIQSPSVATVTINDGTSVVAPTDSSDDQNGVLSLQWAITIPTLCGLAVGVTSCLLLAIIFYWCRSKHRCCLKTQQNLGEDPFYDDIININMSNLRGEGGTVVRNELAENIPLQTGPNEAYIQANNSPLSVVYDLAINTSQNEFYVEPTHNNADRGQGVIKTLRNEAYSGSQALSVREHVGH